MAGAQGADVSTGRWDPLITRLQALRAAVGEPSFAELARRISAQRVAAGADEHAARIARSSVHDAFRLGRTRVNVPLVREIVRALDGDPAVVDEWLAELSAATVPSDPTGPAPATGPTTADASEPAPDRTPEPGSATEPGQSSSTRPSVSALAAVLLMLACLVVNRLGAGVTTYLHFAFYLDMVGTAVVAMALGPWRGAVVGVLTNVAGAVVDGPTALPFALVNVVGALVWGYGVRRYGFGRSLHRFFGLNLVVAACCTLVAAPVLVLMYGGSVGHGQDRLTYSFLALTHQLAISVGIGNLTTSVVDKVLSGFIALVAVSSLPPWLRDGCLLPPATAPLPPPAD